MRVKARLSWTNESGPDCLPTNLWSEPDVSLQSEQSDVVLVSLRVVARVEDEAAGSDQVGSTPVLLAHVLGSQVDLQQSRAPQ